MIITKTISFDLWNTLIILNPKFLDARLNLCVFFSGKTEDECLHILQRVRNDINYKVHRFGIQFTSEQAMSLLCNELKIETERQVDFKMDYYTLFCNNPPIVLPNVNETLTELKKDYRLVLTSNNIMIPGFILKQALSLSLLSMFDKEYFSDEMGISKPNPNFFMKIQTDALRLSHDIIHISDKRQTDIDGAFSYGFKTIQIKSKNFPTDLVETVKHKFINSSIYIA